MSLMQEERKVNDQRGLETLLRQIDGKGYGAYKDLKGMYQCKSYILAIDHVQAAYLLMRILQPLTL